MTQDLEQLKEICRQIRVDILKSTNAAGSGHPGGSLSAVEILVALYWKVMNHKPEQPDWPRRDRFILSKGHAAPALYSALARRGYFDPELLMTLRQPGSKLQGHPRMGSVPGVEASTGSLGQGFSFGVGAALVLRKDAPESKVFVLLGDGEMQEGQVWEAAAAASHYNLNNIIAILDNNGLQIEGRCQDIMCIQPVEEKMRAFGWEVRSVDGHDLKQLVETLNWARESGKGPVFIRAKTVKGKGVAFMENNYKWHGVAPNDQELSLALKQLERQT